MWGLGRLKMASCYTAKWWGTLLDKTLSNSIVKYTARVPLILFSVEKIEHESSILFFIFFLFPNAYLKNCMACMNNLHTKELLYCQRFFFYRAAGELRSVVYVSKHIVVPYWSTILCILTNVTQKVQVVGGCSTYWTTGVLLEMSIFCVRAVREMRLVSYGSKHTL